MLNHEELGENNKYKSYVIESMQNKKESLAECNRVRHAQLVRYVVRKRFRPAQLKGFLAACH